MTFIMFHALMACTLITSIGAQNVLPKNYDSTMYVDLTITSRARPYMSV